MFVDTVTFSGKISDSSYSQERLIVNIKSVSSNVPVQISVKSSLTIGIPSASITIIGIGISEEEIVSRICVNIELHAISWLHC